MAKLTKTSTPGIFRRHVKGCDGRGRCECSYAVVWRHRGRQSTETFSTFAEAREAKGQREGGDSRPTSKVRFEDYFAEWIKSYTGRTARGFSETSRSLYRRSIEDHALARWRTWKLAEIEARDVRALYADLRAGDVSTSGIRGLRAALSALFATAVEDGLLRSNPVQGVRIPAGRSEEPTVDHAKALTREELRLLLAATPEDWRLFFEFLSHTGLRISEAIGLRWQHVELGRQGFEARREGSGAGHRARRRARALGQLPQLPAHLRLAAVRAGPQRQAGGGLARARRPELHLADLRASARRRGRWCRLSGLSGQSDQRATKAGPYFLRRGRI